MKYLLFLYLISSSIYSSLFGSVIESTHNPAFVQSTSF